MGGTRDGAPQIVVDPRSSAFFASARGALMLASAKIDVVAERERWRQSPAEVSLVAVPSGRAKRSRRARAA